MDIQDIIKLRREKLGLTYEEIGNMVGVSKSTVRKWETGMIENMRQDKIALLAKALKITPGYLMGWKPFYDVDDDRLDGAFEVLKECYNLTHTDYQFLSRFFKLGPQERRDVIRLLYYSSKVSPTFSSFPISSGSVDESEDEFGDEIKEYEAKLRQQQKESTNDNIKSKSIAK